MCQSEKDTIEQVLECNKGDKNFNIIDNGGKKWGEIAEIYRQEKGKRSRDNIGEEQNILEEQKNIEDSREEEKSYEEIGDRDQRGKKYKKRCRRTGIKLGRDRRQISERKEIQEKMQKNWNKKQQKRQ